MAKGLLQISAFTLLWAPKRLTSPPLNGYEVNRVFPRSLCSGSSPPPQAVSGNFSLQFGLFSNRC